MKGDNCCIRVYADVTQIERAKERIKSIETSLIDLAATMNLAGNLVRLKILVILSEEGQVCPCDLSDVLGMKISAISQHLRKLKDGKLVSSKRTGQTIYYSVTPEYLQILRPLLSVVPKHELLPKE